MVQSIRYLLVRWLLRPSPASRTRSATAISLLDEAFTDRRDEIKELKADIRNGQNVVIFAPRRFGKTSLVWRATQELLAKNEVLIAQVDLMATPSKEKLAEKLAKSIYEDIASIVFRVREKAAAVFSGLTITPTITLDPLDTSLKLPVRGRRPQRGHRLDAREVVRATGSARSRSASSAPRSSSTSSRIFSTSTRGCCR